MENNYANIIKRLLLEKDRLLEKKEPFKRSVFNKINSALNEENNVIPILFGLRRTGKSTILIQLMEQHDDSIYITFRNSYISTLSRSEFVELIEALYLQGYRYIYLDEVQINNEWSEIVVEIFDSFPKLKMAVTGSSVLNLVKRETGLDRTRKFNIQSLSFGEYLKLSKKSKNRENFEAFLGFGGFPKYAKILAKKELNDFNEQRSEILDEIISVDIPSSYSKIKISLLSRLISRLAYISNGEINVSKLVRNISQNFLERDALEYISILEKSKILIVCNKILPNGEPPKRRKFKIYINPHIHLWILNTKFSELSNKRKGHIVESYWLHWALSIDKFNKTFYYLKDAKGNEIDFVSLFAASNKFKTLHELKWTYKNDFSLDLMKSIDSVNKIIWNINGENVDGISAKSILDTFDKAI